MKALFCHDHKYYRDGDTVISKGQYSADLWARYLPHFNELTVIGRDDGIADKSEKGVNLASCDNVNFHLVPNMNSVKGLLSGRKDIKKSVAKLVSEHDVIILRGSSEIGMMAYSSAKRQGKFIVMEVVSDAWDELWHHGSIAAKIYAPLRFMMQRHLTRNCDASIYVSDQFLQKRYPFGGKIYAAVSDVALKADDFYHADRLPAPDRFKIGLIGTLKNRLKGVAVAIEAARILQSRDVHNFDIHILGPGDPAAFAKLARDKNVADHIHFDGIRPSGQPVLDWLHDLDIYIQPSFQEGLPRAVVEAMSQSLPIIGSDAGGITELIDNDWIVKRGDARALADKIDMMMTDHDRRAVQAIKNHDKALNYMGERLDKTRDEFWRNVVTMASQNSPK